MFPSIRTAIQHDEKERQAASVRLGMPRKHLAWMETVESLHAQLGFHLSMIRSVGDRKEAVREIVDAMLTLLQDARKYM